MRRPDDAALRTMLQLGRRSTITAEVKAGSAGPYALITFPAGLTVITRDLAALEMLATAVMDARAELLTAAGKQDQCGSDTPDALQRRYTGLGLTYQERTVVTGPVDWSQWLTAAETADLLKVTPRTLWNWRNRGTGPQFYRVGHRQVYKKAEVLDFRDNPRAA